MTQAASPGDGAHVDGPTAQGASDAGAHRAGGDGSRRMAELFTQQPKPGGSPTLSAWPQFVDFFKVAGQPVQGPWPPHQEPRPEPEADALPVAIPDPEGVAARYRPRNAP